jgi:hypothetical protein
MRLPDKKNSDMLEPARLDTTTPMSRDNTK